MSTPQQMAPSEMDFDHTDQAFANDSSQRFQDLHAKCPVAHSSKYGGFWVLSKYTDVIEATRNTAAYSSAQGVSIPDVGAGVPLPPLQADPPIHTHFRRILQQEFSRGRMNEVEGFVRELTNELIDEFIDDGSADLMEQLVTPLPAVIIAQLMGFPRADWTLFRDLLDIMILAAISGDAEAGGKAAMTFLDHLGAALADRRESPRDDMLTRIAHSEIDGRPITDVEALGTTWTTVVAGHETTVGGIGALLMHVGRDPELKAELLADPQLIPKAVEETIRLEAPIQGMRRSLTEDVCVRGRRMLAGDDVWLSYAAANRDAEKFVNPDEFDLERSPNRHVGFGDGIHRCVGAPLAQLEMRVVLEEILRRIPGFSVTADAELQFHSTQSRKLLNLPVSW